ncbi:WD40 repeat domain-containing protein, partial [Frankia sp. Cr1]|uniref:WD40 repeat domain-containing protein n=1 Tax=Frankia sp. Cr1 TaxID=3073931 RepID=UPI002AD53532
MTPTGTAPEVSQDPTASPSAAATGLRQVASFAGATLHVDPLAFSPDGRTLAGNEGSEKRVRLWDVETGKATATITAPGNVSVGFTPDGRALAT